MQFTTSTLALLAAVALPAVQAGNYIQGANVAAQNAFDGLCKSESQWEDAFNLLRGLSEDFHEVRVYASSDCNTLANAVPAALKTNTGIMVGVWTEDQAHYEAEKTALQNAINEYGGDWITAISVGSEDLYRKDTDATTLANQINEVRKMVRDMGVLAGVGHVDTWTAWVDGANTAVIKACDFIGMDAYPYWQGADINSSIDVFFSAYQQTKDAVSNAGSGAWVWITETSWPVSGATVGAAVASPTNAQHYWSQTICQLFNTGHTYFYVAQDYNQSPSFGVFNSTNQPAYDLTC